MEQLIRLAIRGISLSQIQSGIYVLLLEEESGRIKLPIVIESLQAQSIASAIGKRDLSRSFTHDLFLTFSKVFHIRLKSVVIYKLVNGIFFSYILFERENKEHKIDSKTSDAVALAVRFQAPIYTTKEIFDKAGIYFENGFPENDNFEGEIENKASSPISFDKEKSEKDLEKMTERDLNALLNHAVVNECYELAARIKKELDRRE
ncbi:bifunctional nuclease family protein [Blattabacterium sp. (Cryptocercus kyebangensis)]|uniref:bifunctional nuclease family protein n=1 Tax=Blattabacterium sp. (Cryptocercus kyebangensis) TaxID=298656 RepID=UPI000D7BC4E6|nr:bifunctional nuclease family protein [Blattabacterium sp. (Cryptocercus kyebangensis)]AWU43838.1 bifunctional nuclease family protein [Blattabacterium sp. (Cryptocercus kyebangensis)]